METNHLRERYLRLITEKDSVNPESANRLLDFWKRIERAEHALGIELEANLSRDHWISLYAQFRTVSISMQTFFTVKSRLAQYISWLINEGVLEENALVTMRSVMYVDLKPDEVFDTLYFRDFQSLQDQIEATLSLAAKVDDNVFATQIAAIYMAWCGLSAEEALSIRKADVLEDRVICGDKILHPNRTIMRFLQDYRDADGYYSQARAVIYLKYMPSEYLFRTARDAHIEDTKALRIFIRNFGKCSGEGNLFHYDKVFTSGTFHRAYLHELANGNIEAGDLNTLRSVFKEPFQSISQANKRLHEYKKYRDYFFPYQDK